MLSRASSDAAGRLRRAKSTSSANPRQHTQSLEIEPDAARQQALAAAQRAYEKANGVPPGSLPQHGPMPARQASRGERKSAEGRHLGTRRSLPRLPTANIQPISQYKRHGEQVMHGRSKRAETDVQSSMNAPMSSAGGKPDSPMRSKGVTQTLGIGSKGTPNKNDHQIAASPANGDKRVGKDVIIESEESAVAAARDKHLQQFQSRKIRARPSFLSVPLAKPQSNVDRIVDGGAETVPEPQQPQKQRNVSGSSKPERRSKTISKSLAKTIKRFLHRGSTRGDLPPQQVEASRLHFSIGPMPNHEDLEGLPRRSGDTVERLLSPTPSLRCMKSQQSLRSESSGYCSIRSANHSLHESSRVTSWNTSTAANTITTHGTKRLSVIKEDGGPHQAGSTSYSLGTRKMEQGFKGKPRRIASGFSIYSALMRRIDESDLDKVQLPAEDAEINDGSVGQDTHNYPRQHSKFNSLASSASRLTRSTIRAVTSRENFRNFSASSKASSTIIHNDNTNVPEGHAELSAPTQILPPGENRAATDTTSDNPTSAQRAQRLERAENRWKSPLEDVRSVFFPSSSRRIFYTDNPYELAPRATDLVSSTARIDANDAKKENATPVSTRVGSDSRLMSPSIYSCDTSSNSPHRNTSSACLARPHSPATGTAIITPTQPVARYSIGAKPALLAPHHVPMQSKDWRAWTAQKMADLESEPTVISTVDGSKRSVRKTGHRREKAQINDEASNTTVPAPAHNILEVTPPLFNRKTRNLAKAQAPSKATEKMNERFPYLDTSRNASSESDKSRRKKTSPRTAPEAPAKPALTQLPKRNNENSVPDKQTAQQRHPSQLPHPTLHRPLSTSHLPSSTKTTYHCTPPSAFASASAAASPSPTTLRTPPQIPKRPTPRSKENTPPARVRPQLSQPGLLAAHKTCSPRAAASAAALHGRYRAGSLSRKPLATAAAMQRDEDGMMKRISRGPWQGEGTPERGGGAEGGGGGGGVVMRGAENKENVGPGGGAGEGQGAKGYGGRAVDVFERIRREREGERGVDGGERGRVRVGSLSPAFI